MDKCSATSLLWNKVEKCTDKSFDLYNFQPYGVSHMNGRLYETGDWRHVAQTVRLKFLHKFSRRRHSHPSSPLERRV